MAFCLLVPTGFACFTVSGVAVMVGQAFDPVEYQCPAMCLHERANAAVESDP